MKSKWIRRIAIAAVVIVALLVVANWAMMSATKRHSPFQEVTGSVGGVDVAVRYCRPSKKDRVIFGGLVPYGEVWRTGANEATELEISADVLLAGERVPAGTYSLFTIPSEAAWTIIVDKKLGQWGSYDYDPATDLLRVQVPSTSLPEVTEMLTITVESAAQGSELVITWDTTQVRVPLSAV